MYVGRPLEILTSVQIQNFFHRNTKTLFAFFTVDMCTNVVKSMVDKTSGNLAEIKEETMNFNQSSVFFITIPLEGQLLLISLMKQ